MFVFRIHIKPGGKGKEFSFDYCLKNGLLGVGWAISVGPGESIDWKTYEERAEKEYGNISKVKYINKWVAKDPLSKDLIWTRTNDGHYYLGMILSPWEYFDNPEAREADIVNVFRVELKKVNIEDVPGKVIACFRSPSTIQEIVDQTAICYTKILWNELSGKDDYQIDSKIDSIWSLLTDEQVEDIIFLYLQYKDWCVVPNSRKKDTMNFEFYLINKINFERAVVQAKTGGSAINLKDYYSCKDKIFLFQSGGFYEGDMRDNFCILTSAELELFIKNNRKVIPANILRWYERAYDTIGIKE